MSDIVMVGGGLVGLSTAMLLAGDGHRVTVLERDPAPPPAPDDAWVSWERRSVNQFRLPHFLAARFRSIVEEELPDLARRLADAGALRFDPIAAIPDEMTGGARPGDDRFVALTGRRPVVESVVAATAADTEGLEVRRGIAVADLCTEPGRRGAPHARGVCTSTGEVVTADLVIDAGGRRSAVAGWVAAAGGRPPAEVSDDSGFVYFGRHFRSPSGEVPVLIGPVVQEYGSITALTLPADNGTWSVVVVASAADGACRALRDEERWEAVVRTLPLAAHWLDGEPLDEGVAVMARIADRRRSFVDAGGPVVTGALAVGDAWACTNPSLGRGASIGLLHGRALRDLLRTPDPDPVSLATRWAQRTEATVGGWYDATNAYDRHRLSEIDTTIAGRPYEPGDPFWERVKCLDAATGSDPDLLRDSLDVAMVRRLPGELFDDADRLRRMTALGGGWRDRPSLGPSRAELLTTLAA